MEYISGVLVAEGDREECVIGICDVTYIDVSVSVRVLSNTSNLCVARAACFLANGILNSTQPPEYSSYALVLAGGRLRILKKVIE